MYSFLRTSSPKTTMFAASCSFFLFLVVLLNGTGQPFAVLAARVPGKTTRKQEQRQRGVRSLQGKGSGKGSKKSKKCNKDFSFDGNAEGETTCIPETSSLIVGTTEPTGLTAQTNLICQPSYAAFRACLGALATGCDPLALYLVWLCCANDQNYVEGPWFFNRDTAGTVFEFTNAHGGSKGSLGAVCFQMLADLPVTGKGEMEFWSESFFGTRIADLQTIEFDYKIFAQSTPPTNQVFLNIYVRSSAASTAYYNCRFDYVFDAAAVVPPAVAGPSPFKNFKVTLATPSSMTAGPSPSTLGAGNGCNGATTLQAYLALNPMAVIGVGNGELETLAFNTGQTGVGNEGSLGVCWDNVEIRTKSANYLYDFEEMDIV